VDCLTVTSWAFIQLDCSIASMAAPRNDGGLASAGWRNPRPAVLADRHLVASPARAVDDRRRLAERGLPRWRPGLIFGTPEITRKLRFGDHAGYWLAMEEMPVEAGNTNKVEKGRARRRTPALQ
jgi:hypothetical protein